MKVIGFIKGFIAGVLALYVIGAFKAFNDAVKDDDYRKWLRKDLGYDKEGDQ